MFVVIFQKLVWTLNKLTYWPLLFRRTIFSPSMTTNNNNNNNNNNFTVSWNPSRVLWMLWGGGWGGWLGWVAAVGGGGGKTGYGPGFVYCTWHLSWCGPQGLVWDHNNAPGVCCVIIYHCTILQYFCYTYYILYCTRNQISHLIYFIVVVQIVSYDLHK